MGSQAGRFTKMEVVPTERNDFALGGVVGRAGV